MIDGLTAAVDARLDDLYALTAALVREPSLLGQEMGAQAIVENRLDRLGFAPKRIAIDAQRAIADPGAGLPLRSYDGRTNVAGRLGGSGGGRSLHLTGHVDVVPVERADRWTSDPFGAEVRDGRMYGRGAGDMKAGVAAYLLAVEAVLASGIPLRGDVLFSSVIEEECGGNGMWAVVDAGYVADGTLIGEPTDLRTHLNGVGVIWARLTARSAGAHAAVARATSRPVDEIVSSILALRDLEAQLNAGRDDHPFNLNLGEIHGGVWPSSVPAEVVLRCRLGFGFEHTAAQAQALLAGAVHAAAPTVEVTFEGFRAHPYQHASDQFVELVRQAHADASGGGQLPDLKQSTATTDARYVAGPCTCFGPIAGDIHGTDEWVDLASVRQTAISVALCIARWCA